MIIVVLNNHCHMRLYAVAIHTASPISGVHVFQGSVKTLVRSSEITYHHLIAYSLSNISAKNYKNRLMCVKVIVCYIRGQSKT